MSSAAEALSHSASGSALFRRCHAALEAADALVERLAATLADSLRGADGPRHSRGDRRARRLRTRRRRPAVLARRPILLTHLSALPLLQPVELLDQHLDVDVDQLAHLRAEERRRVSAVGELRAEELRRVIAPNCALRRRVARHTFLSFCDRSFDGL